MRFYFLNIYLFTLNKNFRNNSENYLDLDHQGLKIIHNFKSLFFLKNFNF
jgi:hypothetical protein